MPTNLHGFVVFGAIEEKWLAMGGAGSALGVPTSNEAPTFDGVGRGQSFQNGFMSWHPELGAFAVYGLIGLRWNELGREVFGYPITDELGTPNGIGRFNHFRGMHLPGRPEASIYWTPETGAHEVFGAIRDKWASMGWETSPLGFPKNHEEPAFDGVGRFQLFQGGVVSWHPELGAHVIWGLIHELAHAWQLQRNGFVPGYVCAGATSSNYQPPPAGSSWSSDFNIEQQATTVDQWFQRHAANWNTMAGNRVENLRTLLSSADAMRDDYFPYISNHIRMAQV